jgi:hypothetical protein
MYRRTFVFLVFALSLYSQTMLSGNIGGLTFESSGNPYVVTDNITIQTDKTTTIKAGCVFLFNPFSGIIVNGSLSVEGTLQSPVVFTSALDNKYTNNKAQLPNPFDWNGILISQQAGNITISNIVLTYSVYGIRSQKEALSLNNATFKHNGQFHFTVDDEIQRVIEDIPYNYRNKPDEKKDSIKNIDSIETVYNKDTTPGKEPKSSKGKKVSKAEKSNKGSFRKAAPVILAATGLVSGVATAILFNKMSNEKTAYKKESDPVRQKELLHKSRSATAAGIVLGGITAICLPISAILFVKNKKNKAKPVTVKITTGIGQEMNINLVLSF